MEKLKLNLQNCYGIGHFNHLFDFSRSATFLIYAPNGTMKSSLARTLRYFSDNKTDAPRDRFFPNLVPNYELFLDEQLCVEDPNILVVDPEQSNYDTSDKVSTFIASKELKKAYDEIYKDLDKIKLGFLKKLKTISQSNDCEKEFIDTFKNSEKDNFFDLLLIISKTEISNNKFFKFKYNDVFDKKGNVKKFLEKNQIFLDQYIESYIGLLKDSSVFSNSGRSFGTYQAEELISSIADDSFFEAGHKMELAGNKIIDSYQKLRSIVDDEIERIVNDAELKEIFDKVDKAIGANAELRSFKAVIEKDNLILLELQDYENFKRKVWLGYLNELNSDFREICAYFEIQKKTLKGILDEANKEFEIWENLIATFNARFHVPFKVVLSNQEDVILKEEGANLKFVYSGRNQEEALSDKTELLDTISKGEQRAFFILQLLFDIESRKNNASNCLIVFDDIADSFDYKNKYAIIEYIKDLHETNTFKIIILTHNFDFYRTVASRLYLKRKYAVLMASKADDGTVKLLQGQYVNDAFEYLSRRIADEKVFITLIPFLRNLVQYSGHMDSNDFLTLTKCLHIMDGTKQLLAQDIIQIWQNRFERFLGQSFAFEQESIVEMIYRLADALVVEGDNLDGIALENKVTLAIAARLKAEEFMISAITDINWDDMESNQTAELNKLYKRCDTFEAGAGRSLNKVILMTPENIHINAFMFEPLIDMSVKHLADLYDEVKALGT